MILFSGNANTPLANAIANQLNLPLGKMIVERFSDGESRIEIQESVHDKVVFILQSTSPPVHHHLVELCLIANAARNAMAKKIIGIMPYFGYARQDRSSSAKHIAIGAKVCADFLSSVGFNQIVTVDLHKEQLQGFFAMPVVNIDCSHLYLEDILKKNFPNPIVISPDAGGFNRAQQLAALLNNADLAIIDKRRPKPNISEVMNVIGNVKYRDCIIIDDMIDTGTTLSLTAKALKNRGANKIHAYITHPVFSGNALAEIASMPIDELVVTDTIPLNSMTLMNPKIRCLSIASQISHCIRHMSA